MEQRWKVGDGVLNEKCYPGRGKKHDHFGFGSEKGTLERRERTRHGHKACTCTDAHTLLQGCTYVHMSTLQPNSLFIFTMNNNERIQRVQRRLLIPIMFVGLRAYGMPTISDSDK